jgi:hypothetical protein
MVMCPPSDDELDYLLSRGKLGGSQKERILKAALGASREGFWARWRGKIAWSAGGLTLATGAAVLLLVLRAPQDDAASFQVKGPGDAPLLIVSCLGADVNACPAGSKVAFALEGGRDKGGFLTAYAQPTAPGERVWYLTNEAVGAPEGAGTPRVIRKAALIGDGQPPGSYRVHAFYTRRPIAREALANLAPGDTLAKVDVDLVVPP